MPSNSDENAAPPCERTCSQSKCKAKLPSDYNKNTCPDCCKASRVSMARKRDRLTKCLKENVAVTFKDSESTLTHLQKVFKTTERVLFHGCYNILEDLEITDKEHVRMTAQDIWKATGFRFR
jgi:hypothetical protein